MPFQLTCRHMTINSEQRAYCEKKVDHLRHLLGRMDEMKLTLTKEKASYQAEGIVRAGRIAIDAHETAEHPIEAVDTLMDKLEARIRKAKGKMIDKQSSVVRETTREMAMAENIGAEDGDE